jgi:hypothetical protein
MLAIANPHPISVETGDERFFKAAFKFRLTLSAREP